MGEGEDLIKCFSGPLSGYGISLVYGVQAKQVPLRVAYRERSRADFGRDDTFRGAFAQEDTRGAVYILCGNTLNPAWFHLSTLSTAGVKSAP